MSERCWLLRPGRVDYAVAWEMQRRTADARRAGRLTDDVLILLEHPHVYTLGRRADESHVLVDKVGLRGLGASLYRIERGGDVTYHGPGQLVGYPILDLRRRGADVHRYVRDLEEVIIRTLGDHGIVGARLPGHPGVWVGDEKIAAIGVNVARWISSHGFALNVDPDLSYFGHIVACGLHGRRVTSIARVVGRPVGLPEVVSRLVDHFAQVFDRELVEASWPEVLQTPP